MPKDPPTPAEEIEQLKYLSDFLFELATQNHEHADMLFRLSDNAKAEAERLSGAKKQTAS